MINRSDRKRGENEWSGTAQSTLQNFSKTEDGFSNKVIREGMGFWNADGKYVSFFEKPFTHKSEVSKAS